MTHNANKERTHNAKAKASKQHIAGGAGTRSHALRRSPYGRRLEAMRARRGGEEE